MKEKMGDIIWCHFPSSHFQESGRNHLKHDDYRI